MIDAAGLCIYFAIACHADPGAWAVALITPVATLAVALVLRVRLHGSPIWERLGLAILLIACVGQAVLVWGIILNRPFGGDLLPFWAVEGVGITILAVGYAAHHRKGPK